MSILGRIRAVYWRFREAWAYAGIINHYQAAGHATPYIAAADELFHRSEYLERFRDYATERSMADGSSLEDLKAAFIKEHLGSTTSLLDRQTSSMLRDIILDMRPNEAFHVEAYAKWVMESDALAAELKAEAIAINGPGELSPRQQRVLRGRA